MKKGSHHRSTFQCLTRARDLSIQYKQFNLYTTLAPFSPSATITSTKIQNGSMFTASNTDTTSDPQKQVTTSHQTATQSRFSSWLKHYNQLVNDKIEFLLSWHCNNDTSPAFDTLSFNEFVVLLWFLVLCGLARLLSAKLHCF